MTVHFVCIDCKTEMDPELTDCYLYPGGTTRCLKCHELIQALLVFTKKTAAEDLRGIG